LIFKLDSPEASLGDSGGRNVSVHFLLCPEPAAAAVAAAAGAAAAPGALRGTFEARVDMRNGTTACNKLYMATRDNCLTSARFSLLPRDLQRNNGTLDIRVLLDHNVLQVFFAGDHETRFAFSLIFLDS
jgi:hypothetical protein